MQILKKNEFYQKGRQWVSLEQGALDCLSAKLFAAAIQLRYPKASIVTAEADSFGFTCEFLTQERFSQEFFPYLEETVQDFLRRKQVRVFEMVRDSAIPWLQASGNRRRAKELTSWSEGLISMVEIEGYGDFAEEFFDLEHALETLHGAKLVALEEVFDEKRKLYQIKLQGIGADSSQELKELVKRAKEALKLFQKSDEFWAYNPSGLVILSEGTRLKNQLLELWKRELTQAGLMEIEAYPQKLLENLSMPAYFYKDFKISEGGGDLYTPEGIMTSFCGKLLLKQEKVPSFVASLCRLIACFASRRAIFYRQHKRAKGSDIVEFVKENLQGYAYEWREIEGKKEEITFCMEDALGRLWEVLRLTWEIKESFYSLSFSLCDAERWLILAIHEGRISFEG